MSSLRSLANRFASIVLSPRFIEAVGLIGMLTAINLLNDGHIFYGIVNLIISGIVYVLSPYFRK